MLKSFCALDTETTGLVPRSTKHRAFEISCVKFVNNGQEWSTTHLTKYIRVNQQELQGLTRSEQWLAHLQSVNHQKEVSVGEALRAVREFAGNMPLVCHNASFDKLVLENEISKSKFDWKIENEWICTLELARKKSAGKFVGRTPWRSDGRSYTLEHVAKHLGVEVVKEKLHSGFYDAAVAGQVYLSLTSGAPIQKFKFQASPEPKIKAGVSLQFGDFHEKLAQLPGVYQFSFGSNQFYIGSSSNIKKRYVRHCRNLLDVNHPNRLVQRAFNERGADVFDFRVVRYVTNAEEAASLEANLIEKLREEGVDLFNLTADGGSRTGLAKDPLNPIAVSEWREKSGIPSPTSVNANAPKVKTSETTTQPEQRGPISNDATIQDRRTATQQKLLENSEQADLLFHFGDLHERLAPTPGVYQFSLGFDQYYIGSTSSIEKTYLETCNELINGSHPIKSLQRAFNQHGAVFFHFSVLRDTNDYDEATCLAVKLVAMLEREHVNIYNSEEIKVLLREVNLDPVYPISIAEWEQKSAVPKFGQRTDRVSPFRTQEKFQNVSVKKSKRMRNSDRRKKLIKTNLAKVIASKEI